MNPYGQVAATIGKPWTYVISPEAFSPKLTLNQWNFISATFTLKTNLMNNHVGLQVNGRREESANGRDLSTPLSASATDLILLGGPLAADATIYKIKIYSPGAFIFSPCKRYNWLLKDQ